MKKLTYYFLSALALFFISLTYMTHQHREEVTTILQDEPCNSPIETVAQEEKITPKLVETEIIAAEQEKTVEPKETVTKKQEAPPKPTFVAAKHAPKNPFKEKKYKDSIVVITGEILGKRTNRIKVRKRVDDLSDTESIRFKVSKKDKTFSGKVVLHESGYYRLYYRSKKYMMYLTPGDSLHITFDPDSEEGVVYSGTSAGINTYLAKRDQYDDDNSLARRKLYRMPYTEFRDTIAVERKVKEEFLWSYVKDINEVPAKFVGFELAHIAFEWANQYLDYQEQHPKYAPNDFESMDKFNYKFVKKLDLKTNDLLYLESFEQFITRYLDIKADPRVDAQVVGSDINGIVISERHRLKYNFVREYFKGKKIRNYLRTKVVLNLIGEDGTPTMNPVLLKFRDDVKNEDYRELVDEKYAKYAMIDAGSFAPDFEGVTINNRKVRLSDFSGKYVYIDVWATWCGPCKHEQPYFEKLKEEYKGRNIEFISISIDKSRFAWENMIREKNMQGHQLFINGDFDSNFASLYSVKAVPQFILIDPQGQIIDLTARHPSGRVREDLAMLNL